MPKCINGHEASWELICQKCGGVVNYEEASNELSVIPQVEVKSEELSILSVGFPTFGAEGAYECELLIGNDDEQSTKNLTLKRLDGGTWLDYHRSYSKKLATWLRCVGFNKAKYRVMIVDTTSLLSVLALLSPAIEKNTVIFATTADGGSSPMDQNTSYVSVEAAFKRGFSLIVATNSFVKNVACFVEEAGLIAGPRALGQIVAFQMGSIAWLSNTLERDSRFGIHTHSFSTLMAASNSVYKTMDDVFLIQRYQNSLGLQLDEVVTALLLASSQKDVQDDLSQAYYRHCKQFSNLLDAQCIFNEKSSRYGFFDLFFLYGLRESRLQASLRKGYEAVSSNVPMLKAGEIP